MKQFQSRWTFGFAAMCAIGMVNAVHAAEEIQTAPPQLSASPAASVSSATNITGSKNGTLEGAIAAASCGGTTITQSVPNDTTITPSNSISCNANGVNTDNFYARNYSIASPRLVKCIDFAVETNTLGPYNVRVRMYTHPSPGTPVTANMVLIAGSEQQVPVPPGASSAFFTATYTGSGILVPAGNLVVELFTPSRFVRNGGDGGSIFIGTNNLGQSAPTYIKAADCGIADYIDFANIDFPSVHLLQRLGTFAGNPCQQPLPACPADMSPVGGNGFVNVDDLLKVINGWGGTQIPPGTGPRPSGDCDPLPNGNCFVNVDDLLRVINSWGPCPGPVGGCCLPGTCAIVSQAQCLAMGGLYLGNGTNCGPPAPPCEPVVGDECAGRFTVNSGVNNINNSGATTNSVVPGGNCTVGGVSNFTRDIWCNYTATCNGNLTIDTCATTSAVTDTVLAVYTGACTALVEVGCDDDACPGTSLRSSVTVPAVMGVVYRIRVGSWNASPAGAIALTITCTAVAAAATDIDVDTDRNNAVDVFDEAGEDAWTRDRGALYLVNVDDDGLPDAGKSDSVEFGVTVAGTFQPEVITVINDMIDSDPDKDDITPLMIRKIPGLPNKTVKLRISDQQQIRAIHVFKKIGANEQKIWGGPAENALEITLNNAHLSDVNDTEFGIEGLKFRCVNTAANEFGAAHNMLFKGFVQIELEVKDNTTLAVETDRVLLKVAPVVLLANSQESIEVYMRRFPGAPPANQKFIGAFETNVPGQVKTYTSQTQWAQDDIEVAYTETPRSRMHITLYTRHHKSTLNVEQVQVGDGAFIRPLLLKPGRGIYRSPGYPDADINTEFGSSEYGGNLELMPFTGLHQLGRINYGWKTGTDIAKHGMSAKKRQFLMSQEVQSPFEVDTSWLSVGHVDEFISYVKGDPNSGNDGTVVLASPYEGANGAYTIINGLTLPLNDSGAPSEENPGVLFARGTNDLPPITLAAQAEGGFAGIPGDPLQPATIVDFEQNFFGDEDFQFVRIYEGPGAGQVAHVLALSGQTIVVDAIWPPFDPTDFVIMQPGPGDLPGAMNGRFYYPVTSQDTWFTPPTSQSKYILIEDSEYWLSEPTPLTAVAGGPMPPANPIPAVVTAKEIKNGNAPYQRIKKVNELAQARIDAAKGLIDAAAKKADSTAQVITYKFVPVIYTGTLNAAQNALEDRSCFAWTPGAANIQYANQLPTDPKPGPKLFIAKQNLFNKEAGMNVEKFGPVIDTELNPYGKVVFVDNFDFYHRGFGEVHCGSNVLRKMYGFKWWTKQPATVPNLP